MAETLDSAVAGAGAARVAPAPGNSGGVSEERADETLWLL